jgi:hypothetical protein
MGSSQVESARRKRTLLGGIEAEMAGEREGVVGVVELADGRTKRSRDTIR